MILDSTKKFIALEYSNAEEYELIMLISVNIYSKKQASVTQCGSENNIYFSISLPHLFFLITVSGGLESVQTDQFGRVTDPKISELYVNMTTLLFLDLITGYCFLRDTPMFIEIWDVCIFSEHRASGIGNLLISNAVQMSPKNFWLIVKPDNTPAATLYIKNGFVPHSFTTTDSSGEKEVLVNPSISMIFNKQLGNSFDIENNKRLFKIFSDKILGIVKIETLNIKIEERIIEFLTLITKTPFFSKVTGCLIAKHNDRFNITIDNKDGIPYVVLGLNKNLIKGTQDKMGGLITDCNFVFITQPVSPFNYHGLVVQLPSIYDMNISVQNILVNMGKRIKTQKSLFFYFDAIISISISPYLTEFILKVLDESLISIDQLRLIFGHLILTKMSHIHEKSNYENNQILLTNLSVLYSESIKKSVRKLTGELSCSFINQVYLKDLVESDSSGLIIQPLTDFFSRKGIFDLTSISIFNAQYYEIPVNAFTEGLYISCENTVVPRNLSELNYLEQDMVDLSVMVREDVLTRLRSTTEDSLFVF